MGVLDVKQTAEHELTLEWESNASNDMIADSTLALITGIDKSPASVKCTPFFPLTFSTELSNAPNPPFSDHNTSLAFSHRRHRRPCAPPPPTR